MKGRAVRQGKRPSKLKTEYKYSVFDDSEDELRPDLEITSASIKETRKGILNGLEE